MASPSVRRSGSTPGGVALLPEKSRLVLFAGRAYKGGHTTPETHTVAVPTRRSTLPTGCWSDPDTPGATFRKCTHGSQSPCVERHRDLVSRCRSSVCWAGSKVVPSRRSPSVRSCRAAGSPPRPSPAPPPHTAARRAARPGHRRGRRAGSTRTPPGGPGAPPRVRRARPGRLPGATSTSRSTARATIPLWSANGEAVSRSACTSAATSRAGAVVSSRVCESDCNRWAASVETGWPALVPPVSEWIRANACNGERPSTGREREQLGAHPHRGLGDLVTRSRAAPPPGWTPTPPAPRWRAPPAGATPPSAREWSGAGLGLAASRRCRPGLRRRPTARPRSRSATRRADRERISRGLCRRMGHGGKAIG